MCRACHGSIKKKTQRVVFSANTWPRTYRNGGSSSFVRIFFHAACAKTMFTDLTRPEDVTNRCWDCGQKLIDTGGISICIGSRSAWANLCLTCAEQPRYRKCDACGVVYRKYQTSLLARSPEWWDEVKGKPSFVCDNCADSDALVTVKEIKRMERSERLFLDHYERIMNSIAQGEMFGGPSV